MRIVLMGTPFAAVPTFERVLADKHEVVAVWTQPDKPAGRGNKITFSPVKEFALANNLPIFQPPKIKTAETLELFQSHNADLAVVVAYGRILPQTLLETPKFGCLNVHFSLLPKYRGAAPVNWAIVRGETKTGVTTMKMNAGLDTGDILLQSETAILESDTAPELMAKLAISGADLLSETLRDFDSIEPRAQDHDQSSHAPIMKREDGLITWELDAPEIVNRIRGFEPFPGSFIFVGDRKIGLSKAVAENLDLPLEAGTIVMAKNDDLLISCGANTLLRVIEIQPEGKKRMPVRDFLNGTKLEIGAKFI